MTSFPCRLRIILLFLHSFRYSEQSLNRPIFCGTPVWNSLAITGINGTANGVHPNRIFVDQNNTIYLTTTNLSHVWIETENNQFDLNNRTRNLMQSQGLFVSSSGDIYVDNGASQGQIEKWSLNDSNPTVVMNTNASCTDLFLGPNDTLYCSLSSRHEILHQSIRIAGTGSAGSTPFMLNNPMGIYVQSNGNFYVADCGNNRVQYFQANQWNGTTIVGTGSSQSIVLNCPSDIVMDSNGQLYLTDMNHHRIIGSTSFGFRCILGCLGQGNSPSRLNTPSSLDFDRDGNILVADRGNQRIQKFLLARNACGLSYNQPNLCSSATWNPNATSVINSTWLGFDTTNVFVDVWNTVYIAALHIQTLQIWLEGSMIPSRNLSVANNEPRSVFVTNNGDIYVDQGATSRIVSRRSFNGSSSAVAMSVPNQCHGLFVDMNDHLYCSSESNQVLRHSLFDPINVSSVAADQLNGPRGIFVDEDLNLYVTECYVNRIQKFPFNSLNGTIIAGNGLSGSISLSCPMAIIVDRNGHFYIADAYNNKIIFLSSNESRCLVGCSGSGSGPNQFNQVHAFSFDRDGNIFAVDKSNHRVLKFLLASNSCNRSTSFSSSQVTPIGLAAMSTRIDTTSASSTDFNATQTFFSTLVQTKTKVSSTLGIAVTTPNSLSHTTELSSTAVSSVPQSSSPLVTFATTGQQLLTSSMLAPTIYTQTGLENTLTSSQVTLSASSARSMNVSLSSVPSMFVPPNCSNANAMGSFCNVSNYPCDILQPCLNNGTCLNTNSTSSGYQCRCLSHFNGTQCEFDHRPCQPNTCWNNGTCSAWLNSSFSCRCDFGWEGERCQHQINYCRNVECLNGGICRPSFLNYTCQCLGESFFGRHCERTSGRTVLRQTMSKSFAYIAIIAIATVATFIIVMDVFKYCFGIDPARKEIERRRWRRRKKKRTPLIQATRFIYVNS